MKTTEYYVFQNEGQARAAIGAINSNPIFPLPSFRRGKLTGESATTCWCVNPVLMLSGEFAVPRIPESKLDYLAVSQAVRSGFLQVHGQDIRTLERDDFPQVGV